MGHSGIAVVPPRPTTVPRPRRRCDNGHRRHLTDLRRQDVDADKKGTDEADSRTWSPRRSATPTRTTTRDSDKDEDDDKDKDKDKDDDDTDHHHHRTCSARRQLPALAGSPHDAALADLDDDRGGTAGASAVKAASATNATPPLTGSRRPAPDVDFGAGLLLITAGAGALSPSPEAAPPHRR